MRKVADVLTILGLGMISFSGMSWGAKWQIDPAHSSAQFKVRHLMVSNVTGVFEEISGTAVIDDSDITKSSVEAMVSAAKIDTNDRKRDEHLRSADFFDVKKFKEMTFRSSRIERTPSGRLSVFGDLTIHGITKKDVVFNVDELTDARKTGDKEVRGASLSATIQRGDFGIKWNKTLPDNGFAIGEDVKINLEVEMVKVN